MEQMQDINLDILNTQINKLDFSAKKIFEAKQVEREFILNLVELRKKKNMTQKELANLTGLTQQVISNIEKMDRKPTTINLIRYLLGLGININKIFDKE